MLSEFGFKSSLILRMGEDGYKLLLGLIPKFLYLLCYLAHLFLNAISRKILQNYVLKPLKTVIIAVVNDCFQFKFPLTVLTV